MQFKQTSFVVMILAFLMLSSCQEEKPQAGVVSRGVQDGDGKDDQMDDQESVQEGNQEGDTEKNQEEDPNTVHEVDTEKNQEGDPNTVHEADTEKNQEGDPNTVHEGDMEGNQDEDPSEESNNSKDTYDDSTGKKDTDTGSASVDTDSTDDTGVEDDTDSDTNSGNPPETPPDTDVCETEDIPLIHAPERLMLLQDRSVSMGDDTSSSLKWAQAQIAVTDLVNTWGSDLDIGIDFFSDPNMLKQCTVTPRVIADSLPNNAATIIASMEEKGPSTSEEGDRTPLYLAIESFLNPAHAPVFLDGHAKSYLVVMSDGADNCSIPPQKPNPKSGTKPNPKEGHTPNEFASLVAQIQRKTGVKTIAIGLGGEADPNQLSAIAENGGTEFIEFFNAADSSVLQEALSTIAESIYIGCTFAISEQSSKIANPNLVNVYLDDTPVPRNDDCASGSGWFWQDASKTAIEFCEDTCATAKDDTTDSISIKIICDED